MNEIWKDIPGWEGFYQASDYGQIKSLSRKITLYNNGTYYTKEKIKNQSINRKGYPIVSLNKPEIQKTMTVHRLVALTFTPNVNNKPEINHIDGNKLNNNINNLEWCTAKENSKHAVKLGLKKGNFGEKNGLSKVTKEIVKLIRKSNTLSGKELAQILNVSETTISSIARYKTWSNIYNVTNTI